MILSSSMAEKEEASLCNIFNALAASTQINASETAIHEGMIG